MLVSEAAKKDFFDRPEPNIAKVGIGTDQSVENFRFNVKLDVEHLA